MTLPDFIIIGAMKCGTSTLHDQLAQSPAFYMSEPKETCFFSDDAIYQRGIGWYQSLFEQAGPGQLVGESSTHYTKRLTHPDTVPRMAEHLTRPKFIYVIRHPIDRLVSQYVHEWSQRHIDCDINEAIDRFPELIDYSRYAAQLRPYLQQFGPERVLVVSFPRLKQNPQQVLDEVTGFLGADRRVLWHDDLGQQNASNQRMRKSRVRNLLVDTPGLRELRQWLVPRTLREQAKKLWMLRQQPTLTDTRRAELRQLFDEELTTLSNWLGLSFSCDNFDEVLSHGPLNWSNEAPRPAKPEVHA